MYTWRLFRALRTPPINNPLYLQMQGTVKSSWLDRLWNVFMGLLILLLFVKPPLFIIILLMIPIVYPLVSSTCYGVLFSLRTSSMIFTRRQQGSYDLIRLTPGGAWQAFWGVCAGSVHRNGDLDRLTHYLRRIITVLLTMGLFTMIASLILPTEDLKIEFLSMAIVLFTVIGLMMLEFSQSSVLSTLIGMTFAIYGRTTVDARIGSLVGFLTIQLTTYMTAGVLALSFLYPRLMGADISPILMVLVGCASVLVYVAALREAMMVVLWRLISRGLNAAGDDMNELLYL